MQGRTKFVSAVVLCCSLGLTILAVLNAISIDIYVVVAFLILVSLTELTAPDMVDVGWRRPLVRVIIVGLLVSAVLLVQRVLDTLPGQTLPA